MKRAEIAGLTDWQLIKFLVTENGSPSRRGMLALVLGELGRREALARMGYMDFLTYSAWHEWARRMYKEARPAFKALVSGE
jgi:hypothetical protein